MSYMEYDEDLIGEAPCEFCGDLYPLVLLIEHQTIHLGDDYPEFEDPPLIENFDHQDVPTVESPNIEQQPIEPIGKRSAVTEPKEEIYIIEEKFPVQPPKTSTETTESKETKQNESKKYRAQTAEEFTMKKGEKLLVYGPDIDPIEDLETEKQSYKMPNNPLLNNIPKEDDIEDINNLSDDDCDESLEEFWKRARDLLKRNRAKVEC